jgi:hypothetical protein
MNNVISNYQLKHVVPSSLIVFGLMMEVICSFETSVHTRVKQRHIPEDVIQHVFGGEWSATRPGRLTTWEEVPGTLWIEDRFEPSISLGHIEK